MQSRALKFTALALAANGRIPGLSWLIPRLKYLYAVATIIYEYTTSHNI